ncbi:thioesterase [Leptospira sp. 201903071]|nr:thioesterase [Leptospira ainazelensis]
MSFFQVNKLIRFQHCDPGGVVFTPQYFNLFTEVIEDWFDQVLGFSFSKMVVEQGFGIPAMKIVAKFSKTSLLGDRLTFQLRVKRLRKNNVLLQITGFCQTEKRCSADFLLGFASVSTKSLTDWPESIFRKLQLQLEIGSQ